METGPPPVSMAYLQPAMYRIISTGRPSPPQEPDVWRPSMRNATWKHWRNRENSMSTAPDDLETLLSEVRKTISDNKHFLEKLVDEEIEVDSEDEPETVAAEEEFEEL